MNNKQATRRLAHGPKTNSESYEGTLEVIMAETDLLLKKWGNQ